MFVNHSDDNQIYSFKLFLIFGDTYLLNTRKNIICVFYSLLSTILYSAICFYFLSYDPPMSYRPIFLGMFGFLCWMGLGNLLILKILGNKPKLNTFISDLVTYAIALFGLYHTINILVSVK